MCVLGIRKQLKFLKMQQNKHSVIICLNMELKGIYSMLAFANFVKVMMWRLQTRWKNIRLHVRYIFMYFCVQICDLNMCLFLQDLDPTFGGTREYKLLAVCCILVILIIVLCLNYVNLWQDLTASIEEEDVTKFTDAIKEFDSMTKLVR